MRPSQLPDRTPTSTAIIPKTALAKERHERLPTQGERETFPMGIECITFSNFKFNDSLSRFPRESQAKIDDSPCHNIHMRPQQRAGVAGGARNPSKSSQRDEPTNRCREPLHDSGSAGRRTSQPRCPSEQIGRNRRPCRQPCRRRGSCRAHCRCCSQ